VSPINPSATKTAPATINQCGYSIAESIAYFFAFTFSPWNLDFRAIVAPAQFCCTGRTDIE
jgi:hypothetical protein